jgi:hypothetical protein
MTSRKDGSGRKIIYHVIQTYTYPNKLVASLLAVFPFGCFDMPYVVYV